MDFKIKDRIIVDFTCGDNISFKDIEINRKRGMVLFAGEILSLISIKGNKYIIGNEHIKKIIRRE